VISEIQQAADEVAILRDGRIVTINTVDELRTTAIRHLRLVATGIRPTDLAAVLGALEGVTTIECTLTTAGDAEAVATLSGEIAPFVQVISTLQLKDLMLEEPDLEESVLKLYSAPTPPNTAAATT
jgi:ABC-2 type transport system ATP-binding protein